MDKIIGVMTVWGGEKFVEPCIEQSLYLCDEVLILVGYHNDKMKKWSDKTLEICEKYGEKIKLIDPPKCINETYVKWRPKTLNKLLINSELFSNGNWVFLIDVDEFLFKSTMDKIKIEIKKEYNTIWIDDRFFFYNTKYHTDGCGNYRLWKIRDEKNDRFIATNKWANGPKVPHYINTPKVLKLTGDDRIFHYSMLCNPYQKISYWETEYHQKQGAKTNWVSDKYLKTNLDNNKQIIKSIQNSPARGGEMKIYEGEHPEYIVKYDLNKIKDFRKIYV